ncbi:MAG: hypothetical protein QG652_705 [Pseudomonadota bacterium]|nr:hypothetical protein [Pseudomonadota bacterium]
MARPVVPVCAIWYKAAAFQANISLLWALTLTFVLTSHIYRHMQQGARTRFFMKLEPGCCVG